MSLKYEPSSEPLHISAKQLFLNLGSLVCQLTSMDVASESNFVITQIVFWVTGQPRVTRARLGTARMLINLAASRSHALVTTRASKTCTGDGGAD